MSEMTQHETAMLRLECFRLAVQLGHTDEWKTAAFIYNAVLDDNAWSDEPYTLPSKAVPYTAYTADGKFVP